MLLRVMAYLWALPTTTVGLAVIGVSKVLGPTGARVVEGVIEGHGRGVSWFLDTVGRGAAAMTLGHVVLGQSVDDLEWTRSHERIHVRQCEVWGPLFIPAYLGASVVMWVRGKRPYWDNPFEREAYEKDGRGREL